MTRNPTIRSWKGRGKIGDNFAGGGGVSLAFQRALGRAPDDAINHDDEALAMHAANHPETRHHCESVWRVDPRELYADEPCWAAWFSPDCKDHSTAKGGKPVDKKIRSLAWVAVRWAAVVAPEVIFLENVPEFRDWGPCVEVDGEMRRDPARKGRTFRAFVRKLERLGYVVEWRILKASDYGSPTSRKRLFLVARRDGRPIVWPEPTHGPALLGLKPYRTAAECIDFSLPAPSIFLTKDEARTYAKITGKNIKRPLSDNTLARIAYGTDAFVINAAEPFVVTLRGTEDGHLRSSAGSVCEPLRTISADGNHHALVVPYLVRYNGASVGQPLEQPLGTIDTRDRFGLIAPYLVPVAHGPKGPGPDRRARSVEDQVPTVTASSRSPFAMIVPLLVQSGQGEREGQRPRYLDIHKPLTTVVASAQRHGLAALFIENGNSLRTTGGLNVGHPANQPMSTVTAQRQKGVVSVDLASAARADQVREFLARYGVSNKVRIGGEERTIGDIGYRLLVPRELFRAQGVGDDYVIDPIGPDGKPLTLSAQIRMCGNMVPPPPAEALIRGNLLEAA